MTLRMTLDEQDVHPGARGAVGGFHRDTVEKVAEVTRKHDVVVVGMAQNPHVKKARKRLEEAEVPFEYIEHGSYFSEWKRRLALKMWTGWPTFPMVFVKGQLIGGAAELDALLRAGELTKP